MNRGKAVALGSPRKLKEELKKELGNAYLIYADEPFDLEEKLKSLGFKTALFGRKVKVYSLKPITEDYLKELRIPFKKLKPSYITMEDVFVFRVLNNV